MSELSRTILSGGRLQADALGQLAKVRALKVKRKKNAMQQASLALRDVGDTIKEYGDWKTAKDVEKGMKEVYDADALGAAQSGAEGRLIALKALRPTTAQAAAKRDALMRDAEEKVRQDQKDKLNRAQDWYREQLQQARFDAELNWEKQKHEGNVKAKKAEIRARGAAEREARKREAEQRKATEARAVAFQEALDNGVAKYIDAIELAIQPDGSISPTILAEAFEVVGAANVQTPEDVENAKARIAKELGVPWAMDPDITIPELVRIAEWKQRQERGPEPPDEGDVSERVRLDFNTMKSEATMLRKEWKDALKPKRDALGYDYEEETPIDATEQRRAYFLAAHRANQYAVRNKLKPPFGSLLPEMEPGDLDWLKQNSD